MRFMINIINFLKATDKFFLWPIVIIFICTSLITIHLLLFYPLLPNKLPLFYSLPWGENQLVFKGQLLILPTLLILAAIFNATLAWHLHPTQQVLRGILLWSLIFISLIITITAAKIFFIFI